MKTHYPVRALFCLVAIYLSCQSSIYGQCPNGAPLQTISYDTLLKGGGNDFYDINFPQFDTSQYVFQLPGFDPSKGTLVKVEFQTMISVRYSYTLENLDDAPLNSRIKMIRSDLISSPALRTPVENTLSKTVASPSLAAFDGIIGLGGDFTSAYDQYAYEKYAINYAFNTNIADFLGNGKVLFNYQTTTDFYPTGARYLWNPTTNDSIYFKLVYTYCTTSALPAGITRFSAQRQSSGNIQLAWFNPNDGAVKQYVVERSTNGSVFLPAASIISDNHYGNNHEVIYKPVKEDRRKIFFRIRENGLDGSVRYSRIADVSIPETGTVMSVYPTLTSGMVNVYFPLSGKEDYRVNIISITGQVVQQADFSGTNLLKIVFRQKMPAGLYILEAINKKTREVYKSKIIIK